MPASRYKQALLCQQHQYVLLRQLFEEQFERCRQFWISPPALPQLCQPQLIYYELLFLPILFHLHQDYKFLRQL